MEHFWEAIEYAANTLVFLLAGVLIGAFMYEDIGSTSAFSSSTYSLTHSLLLYSFPLTS